MYAVIESGGKQYRVAVGDKLKVEKLAVAEGDSVNLDRVLMIADGEEVTIGSPLVESPVTATVVGHGKAGKIKVFKMKRRKNYRRTQGHRQNYTELEITGIGGEVATSQVAVEETPDQDVEKDMSIAENLEAHVEDHVESKADQAAESVAGDDIGDKLTEINGIGPVIEKKLLALGISTFKQIAEFDEKQIAEIDGQLNFKGRIDREEWVEQAKKLI